MFRAAIGLACSGDRLIAAATFRNKSSRDVNMSNDYFNLASGSLTQNWSNTGQITANDDWSGVPSIQGFLGDISAATTADVDPRTLTGDALGAIDVIANQGNPNTNTSGGVAEFDGTVA